MVWNLKEDNLIQCNGKKFFYWLFLIHFKVQKGPSRNLYAESKSKNVRCVSLPDKMTEAKNTMINLWSIFGFVVGRNTGFNLEH